MMETSVSGALTSISHLISYAYAVSPMEKLSCHSCILWQISSSLASTTATWWSWDIWMEVAMASWSLISYFGKYCAFYITFFKVTSKSGFNLIDKVNTSCKCWGMCLSFSRDSPFVIRTSCRRSLICCSISLSWPHWPRSSSSQLSTISRIELSNKSLTSWTNNKINFHLKPDKNLHKNCTS